MTVTGDKSKIGKEVEIKSTTKIKDATVDNSKVNIGNVGIHDSIIEKGKIITDSTVDHINAKDSTANIGNINVQNSTMSNGELNSKTVSTGTITLDKGTLEMGNISVKDSTINSGKIISDVENTKTIEATNGGSVSMGNVSIKDKSTISGDNTVVRSVVKNLGGTVTADGNNSKVNMGNIEISGSEVSGGAKVQSGVLNTGTVKATQGGTVDMGSITVKDGSKVQDGASVTSLVGNKGTVTASGENATVSMGNIGIEGGAVVSGKNTEIKSTVTNNKKIEAIGENSKVDLGSIAIVGGKVTDSKVTSTVTNDGTISAQNGGAITMGRIEATGATLNGATLSSTVKVTGSGSVTATGSGAKANFGGIRVGGK